MDLKDVERPEFYVRSLLSNRDRVFKEKQTDSALGRLPKVLTKSYPPPETIPPRLLVASTSYRNQSRQGQS